MIREAALRLRPWAVWSAGAVVLGLGALSFASDAPTPTDDPVLQAFARGGCNRCHAVPGLADAERLDNCAGCHIWIRGVASDPVKREKALQVFPLWTRYEKSVQSYMQVPSLDASMARLDPQWVRSYLQDPHDLRPGLGETMPRFDLDPKDVDTIVGAFASAQKVVPHVDGPNPARVAAGETLFTAKGCAGCHTFGGRHTMVGNAYAPDLQYTRDRMDPDHVAAWIADPQSFSASAQMAKIDLTSAEVLALRDYVLLADTKATVADPMGAAPKAATQKVVWADVEERVFGRICQHCHMNPELNEGRMGPGNAGGFGWPATGVELQTYEGVVANKDAVREALLRRRLEAHRDALAPGEAPQTIDRPKLPGMPLGLPPIPDEDLALVFAWFDQGCPKE